MKVVVLLSLFTCLLSFDIPKIIWAYWNDDVETAPVVTRMCVDNIRHYINGTGWQFIIVNQHTIKDHITEMDRFNSLIAHSKEEITVVKKADILRLFLIKEHGGVWMDINTMLIGDMKWLEQIESNTEIMNKHGGSPQTVLFSLWVYGKWDHVDYWHGQKVDVAPGHEIWFLAAVPNSMLITAWVDQFEASLLRGYAETIAQHKSLGIEFTYNWGVYMMGNIAIQRVIVSKQMQLDRAWALDKSKQRQFAVHHYRVWTLDANASVFSVPAQSYYDSYQASKLYIQIPFDQLIKFTGPPRYFIKLVGEWYRRVNTIFSHYKEVESFAASNPSPTGHQISPNFYRFQDGMITIMNPQFQLKDWAINNHTQKLYCGTRQMPHFYLVRDSLVERYLLKITKQAYNVTIYNHAQIERDCYYDVSAPLFRMFKERAKACAWLLLACEIARLIITQYFDLRKRINRADSKNE